MLWQIPDRNNKLRGFGRHRSWFVATALVEMAMGIVWRNWVHFLEVSISKTLWRNNTKRIKQIHAGIHALVTRNLCFWKLCPDLVPSFLGRSYLWGIGSCPGHLAVNVWCVGRTWENREKFWRRSVGIVVGVSVFGTGPLKAGEVFELWIAILGLTEFLPYLTKIQQALDSMVGVSTSEVTGEEREVEIARSALQMGTVNLLVI